MPRKTISGRADKHTDILHTIHVHYIPHKLRLQCSHFIMLSLGSIGMDHVKSELCYK